LVPTQIFIDPDDLCGSSRPGSITSSHAPRTRTTRSHKFSLDGTRGAAECWWCALCFLAPTISPQRIARLWTYDGRWLSSLWWLLQFKTSGSSNGCQLNKICLCLFDWTYLLANKNCRPAAWPPGESLQIGPPATKKQPADQPPGHQETSCRPAAWLGPADQLPGCQETACRPGRKSLQAWLEKPASTVLIWKLTLRAAWPGLWKARPAWPLRNTASSSTICHDDSNNVQRSTLLACLYWLVHLGCWTD